MNPLKSRNLFVALTLGSIFMSPCLARGNDISIKDGFGEEVQIKHGWFGTKKKVVKDALGDSYVQNQGLFGGSNKEVNVLGNSFKNKKGVFGGSQTEGSTILGDKVTTKKGIFGRRTTSVDLSGSASALKSLFAASKQNSLPVQKQYPLQQQQYPLQQQKQYPLDQQNPLSDPNYLPE